MSGLLRINDCGLTLNHDVFVSRTATKLIVRLANGN